jgi:hypothetical protein
MCEARHRSVVRQNWQLKQELSSPNDVRSRTGPDKSSEPVRSTECRRRGTPDTKLAISNVQLGAIAWLTRLRFLATLSPSALIY